MAKILVLNGPNLNLLGKREPEIYGVETLESINQNLKQISEKMHHQVETFQSNSEDGLIERIQKSMKDGTQFILLNPAAFTHTSVAIRDAITATSIPFIEIHLSNIYSRESFRHFSYFSDIALGTITGLGAYGYELGLLAANNYLSNIK